MEMLKDNFIGERKTKYRDYIEQLGKSSWIGIVCNFWYEFSLAGSSSRYGFDFKTRTVTFLDDGNTRINTSTWPQTGRAVAKLLSLKVLKDDASDKSACLKDFRNKFVYVSSFNISQKDMLDSIMRVTGTMLGFAKLVYSRSFYPDMSGNYEATKSLHNDILGLPKEDLDEYTTIAVGMAEKSG